MITRPYSRKRAIIAFVLIMLTFCVAIIVHVVITAPRPGGDDWTKVEYGMSRAEAYTILGEPTKVPRVVGPLPGLEQWEFADGVVSLGYDDQDRVNFRDHLKLSYARMLFFRLGF